FVWQGVLILLPVAALVLFALLSLRQDRKLAENEAREKAQTLADDGLEQVMRSFYPQMELGRVEEVSDPPGESRIVLIVSATGELVRPRLFDPVPVPNPIDLSQLDPEASRLWQEAGQSALTNRDPEGTSVLYEQFLARPPPSNWIVRASYALGS